MNSNKPLVSIVIPTYNSTNTISYAIESVLSQSYNNFELIIVDDGSDPPEQSYLQSLIPYLPPNTQLILLDLNQGVSNARNTGIRAASGSYIAFLDSDDQWLPTKLEKQVDLFTSLPPYYGLVYTWTANVKNNKIVDYTKPTLSGQILEEMLYGQPLASCSSLMVRRFPNSITVLFNTTLKSGNDGDYIRQIAAISSVALIPEVLVRYTIRPNSLTRSPQYHQRSIVSLLHKLYTYQYDYNQYPLAQVFTILQLAIHYLHLGDYDNYLLYLTKALTHRQLFLHPFFTFKQLLRHIRQLLSLFRLHMQSRT